MIFAEGIESMFRIAIALLKKNRDVILTMEFETVVEYLKNGLFDVYLNITTNNLIADAAAVKITKARLDKLQAEFEDQLKKETDINSLGSDQLRTQNRHMSDQLKKLESAYELLNREHIALANENVEKTNLIEKLLLEKEELLEQVNGLRSVVQDDRMRAEKVVKDEMDGLMRKNLGLTSRNVELQDHLNDICVYLVNDLSHKLSSEDLRTELNRKVGQLTDKI